MLTSLFFYLFAAMTVASGIMVITARNPVHAVLFLILSFFNAAGLFVIMGAEFLAMLLVVVYVGAVAVLFLFVVMMLDIDYADMREGFQRHLPIGGIVGLILLVELVLIFSGPGTTIGIAPIETARSNTSVSLLLPRMLVNVKKPSRFNLLKAMSLPHAFKLKTLKTRR